MKVKRRLNSLTLIEILTVVESEILVEVVPS